MRSFLPKLLVLSLGGLAGCYTSYQLTPPFTPTPEPINRMIEVETKYGQIFILVRYAITSEKIIGQDENGKPYEESLQNIKRLRVIRKLSTGSTIIVTVLTLSFLFIFALGLAISLSGGLSFGT
jgi:hypothetical protein